MVILEYLLNYNILLEQYRIEKNVLLNKLIIEAYQLRIVFFPVKMLSGKNSVHSVDSLNIVLLVMNQPLSQLLSNQRNWPE